MQDLSGRIVELRLWRVCLLKPLQHVVVNRDKARGGIFAESQ